MAYLFYYLILLPVSWLPLPVLYGIGRFFYWLGYRVLKYRRKVVYGNIRGSFPDWTEAQVEAQVEKFYRYFFDSLAESIKMFSISERESVIRCRVENPELLAPYTAAGKSVIIYGAHYANWEIAAISFPSQLNGATVMAIYSPLKNETLDGLTHGNRTRTGLHLVSRREVDKYFEEDPVRPAVEIFIADQSPSNAAWYKVHWTHFLNRTTSFLMGPERYAVRYDRPVFYMNLRMEKRGHYVSRLFPVTDKPRETEPGFITEKFVRQLETEIQRDPTPWLWTHRRWKRGVAPEAAAAMEGKDWVAGQYER
ncbi:acetyltransferase [Neolewinella aurantiaca]|uniref:Acetyltransferase n=1 Tax=Neolewinella aurantiaca TaxID=2602767 RepID=A0A5C7FQU8_9BACT|nr:lysophospholipid acyltransferase family protein [Neolewinella aurantiaca]TXF87075.1 acetyltransferase [Neolewinella aurantiaca]